MIRLTNTELARINIESTLKAYEDIGVNQVVYLTAKDEKVCEVCGMDDGVVFDIDKVPILPRHANCRCSIVKI